MKPIGLVIRPSNDSIIDCADTVLEWAAKHGHEVVVEQVSAQLVGWGGRTARAEDLVTIADPIVSLGGDGTLLGIGRHVQAESPTLIGVNFGNLGFLTEITPSECLSMIERTLRGEVKVAKRSMLFTSVTREGDTVFTSQAVNDAVILKGTTDRLLDLDIWVNGEYVVRSRGDGVIVSTPTGSTAYSLAAGGSIAYPSLAIALVTPVCAHSLTSRPLILPIEAEIQVRVPLYDGRVFLSVDGQDSFQLISGDAVYLTKSPHTVNFVRSPKKSYFEILRSKLNWGISNKSDG